MAERAHTSKPGDGRAWLQRKSSLRIGSRDDAFEREADRVADAVASGQRLPSGFSLSRIPVDRVQREEENKPKTDEEKYLEAAKKVGEAFLETETGKKLKERVEQDPLVKGAKETGEAFIGTLPGKIITGAAAVGAVTALAATHKELPMQVPEIPLDRLTPGLKMKITWEGPVDNPSKAMISFSYSEQVKGSDRKPAKTRAELQREENARMAQDQARFRAGLRYAPGTPEAQQQQAEDEMWRRAAFSNVGKLPGMGPVPTFPGLSQSQGGYQPQLPGLGFRPRPISLLDQELGLKPASEVTDEGRKKEEGTAVQRKSSGPAASGAAPAIVGETLSAPGQPLDSGTRQFMEDRLGRSLGEVRIHTDATAARSARAVNALAYTVGRDIVFSSGAYSPHTAPGQRMLAHELAHVVQQGSLGAAGGLIQRQEAQPAPQAAAAPAAAQPAQPAPAAVPPPPRQDYVFIMGQDPRGTGNPFYTMAERFYRTHIPNATFVTNIRNLADLLNHVATNITQPIGNLYIVSHANEDGTLSFGLDSADADNRLSVMELRNALHPSGGGASALTSVTNQIDDQTRIRIKGCDIGRTQAMVELLDEAFGGAGTVTAPTHEQVYGTDPTLEQRARTEFRGQVEASHPMPPEVDTSLRGRERTQAVAARRTALRQRQRDIQAELTARRGEEDTLAQLAGTYEAVSGPMFQRPGTALYTAAEIRPEVDRLYGHLAEAQRASLVRRLIAADQRPAATAARQGTFQQQGQRVDRRTPLTFTFQEPQTLAEARRTFASQIRANKFTPTQLQPATQQVNGSNIEFTFVLDGTISQGRRQPPRPGTLTFTTSRPDDATLIARAQAQLPNPERYAIRVDRQHAASGTTTLRVIVERVVAYLHHGSLDPSTHEHFSRPESNPDFFATSTFAPPPPPAPPAATGGTTP